MSIQIPARWKKGKFLRGELEQYLKICSPEEKSLIFMAKLTDPKQENDKGANLAVALVSAMTLNKMLKKNEKKTVIAPRLVKRYRAERNARIRRKLLSILNVFRNNKEQTIIEVIKQKREENKLSYEEIYELFDYLKFVKRDLDDKARDVSSD